MIIKELPRPGLANRESRPNLQNEVICASTKANYHYPCHTTPYLLVANFNDTGSYQVNSRHISVNDKQFYFLNAGDELEIDFKNKKPLETLLILFSETFIKSWINYRHTGIESLLANGAATADADWSIPNIPFEYNAAIIDQLSRVRQCQHRKYMDGILFELLECFWGVNAGVREKLDHFTAKKNSTKEELYRRLVAAKIFIHDNFNNSPSIEDIASEACLDKFHFLKLFKRFYGVTPHQYIIKLKLEHAFGLLASGRFTVIQVCSLIGFESQGTFSNLFKKYHGVLPSEAIRGKFPILNK